MHQPGTNARRQICLAWLALATLVSLAPSSLRAQGYVANNSNAVPAVHFRQPAPGAATVSAVQPLPPVSQDYTQPATNYPPPPSEYRPSSRAQRTQSYAPVSSAYRPEEQSFPNKYPDPTYGRTAPANQQLPAQYAPVQASATPQPAYAPQQAPVPPQTFSQQTYSQQPPVSAPPVQHNARAVADGTLPVPQYEVSNRATIQPAAYQANAPQTPMDATPGSSEPIAAPPAQQGEAESWTLERVTRIAEMYNPVLRRAVARIQSARGDALQAGLYPNPRFDTNNPEVFAGSASNFNAGFMQDIVVKGKLRLERAAATEVVRQKELGFIQDRFDVLTEVRKQFYSTLAAQRRVQVLEEIVGIQMEALRASDGRVKAGEGTTTESLLIGIELQRTENTLISARTVLIGELKQLASVIGLPDLVIPFVVGELTKGFPEFDEDSLRRFVVGENAQSQIARREINKSQYLYQRARVEPYPNLRVGPAYSYFPAQAPGTTQFWFTVQFDIPTWNRNQGNILSTEADIVDSVASLGAVQNDLLRQVADALSQYRSARERARRYETEILPNARRAQQLVRDGYLKGVLDISTFLQSQRTLSDATVDYIDALDDTWQAAADLANLLQLEQFP
jgi:cobalt-zinc-cadmium efflux system outer membrane protein